MTNSSRLTYTPRPDATPESELDALTYVYHFVLERHAARAAAAGSCRLQWEGGDDESLTKVPDEDVDSPPMRKSKFGNSQVTSKEDCSS